MSRRRRKRHSLFWISAIVVGIAAATGGGAAAVLPAGGTYSCSQLEQLWESAGGSDGTAFEAAEIARAESGGVSDARDPAEGTYANGSVDYGLWQINSTNGGSVTSYIPSVNARQAVGLYDQYGWEPWITWRKGAEAGQC